MRAENAIDAVRPVLRYGLVLDAPFTSADWKRLRALRERFLTDARAEYWTPRDLELYDATFARRIEWKWNAVLAALDAIGWRPQSSRLVDWGCGTGVAARAVTAWSGIREAELFDQSSAAIAFGLDRLRAAGGHAQRRAENEPLAPGTLLVLSHVIGELEEPELTRLAAFAATADEIIWVEPGSREISRRLSAVRDALAQGGHRFVAPCPHDAPCPMLAAENERHWCHFFAPAPPEVFHSAFWREFSREVEVDLRSLPYSFLASSKVMSPRRWPDGERMIGRPREYKAHLLTLGCGSDGALHDRMLQKRDEPAIFRAITKKNLRGVFAWDVDAAQPGRVRGARHLA